MSLDLDKRQLAMLREMGIRLWQPAPHVAAAEPAAAAPEDTPAPAAVQTVQAVQAVQAAPVAAPPFTPSPPAPVRASAAPTREPPAAPAPLAAPAGAAASSWTVGDAQALYTGGTGGTESAPAPTAPAGAGRWLLLVETPSEDAQSDPFSGEVGKLLDNMLRAVRLHQGAEVWLVPVLRQPGAAALQASLLAALTALIGQRQPDVLLIMGRLAAQALLQSTEPLGKLRGQVHALQTAAAVVTYDAASLLRNPADKAKAWDDLCLALHTAQQGQTRRKA